MGRKFKRGSKRRMRKRGEVKTIKEMGYERPKVRKRRILNGEEVRRLNGGNIIRGREKTGCRWCLKGVAEDLKG